MYPQIYNLPIPETIQDTESAYRYLEIVGGDKVGDYTDKQLIDYANMVKRSLDEAVDMFIVEQVVN